MDYYIPPAAAIVQPAFSTEEQILHQELFVAKQAALEAGKILLKYFNTELTIELKEGKGGHITPVTAADFASNELICKLLVENFPGYGLLTEEQIDDPKIGEAISRWREAEWTWIIDPLDGTSGFILGNPDFGIHIGLCHNGIPVLGVNYFPALQTMYWAVLGQGAYKLLDDGACTRLFVNRSETQLRAIQSFSGSQFTNGVLTRLSGRSDYPKVCSTGLKISLIAEGAANFYISQEGRGGLWDFCSSQIILQEAGGIISDRFGQPIEYRAPVVEMVFGTLVSGSEPIYNQALEISKAIR